MTDYITNTPEDRGFTPLVLRNYQKECLEIMKGYEGKAALVVLATGLGKTAIFTEFIRHEVLENNHTCLIISHRAELVEQPLKYLKDLPCGIEMSYYHADPDKHKVISASVQSLTGRLPKYNPREIDTIIIDEAHHATAPTYRRILNYFKNATIYGFTATAHRYDDVGLGNIFDDIIYEKNVLWGIENKYLCPVECFQAPLKYRIGTIKINEYGELNQNDVAELMSGTALGVSEAYFKLAKGQTIIYAASISEGNDIVKYINKQAGRTIAVAIFGNTRNRQSLLDLYTLGTYKVLVNYGVLTEGTDLPCTETIIIARPIARTNPGTYAQLVGRGLRLYPGKEKCRIIDCIGISEIPLCTAATLFGKDIPEEKAEKHDKDKNKDEQENLMSEEFNIIISRPDTMIKDIREVNVIEKGISNDMHNVAWVKFKNGSYLLAVPNVVYKISKPMKDENGKDVHFLYRNKKSSKSPMDLQFLFDFVYSDLKKNHKKNRHIWDKTVRSYWDKDSPSEAQINLIKKLAPDYNIDTGKMTRGEASMLIQSLIYIKNMEVN